MYGKMYIACERLRTNQLMGFSPYTSIEKLREQVTYQPTNGIFSIQKYGKISLLSGTHALQEQKTLSHKAKTFVYTYIVVKNG